MKCKKCRKKIPDGSKFCNFCGAKQGVQKMYRRPDGLYEKIIIIDGKRKAFRGKSEKEVTQKIAKYNVEQEQGPLFEKVVDDWEAECYPTIKYNTERGYRPRANRAKGYFKGEYIKNITPLDIKTYIAEFPKSWAFKTQNAYLSVLSLIFAYAVREGIIKYNVAENAKLPSGLKREHRRPPTDEEIKRIDKSANIDGGLLAQFFLYTGLRRGEAVALTWGDIDFKEKTITVNKSTHWESNTPVVDTPKTTAGIRKCILPDLLIAPLKKLKRKRKANKNDIVFCDADGKMFTNKRFASCWKNYQKAAGLQGVTPHMLRHGYATMLEKAGVSKFDAQHLLGHANYATTADVYTHFTQQAYTEAAEKIKLYTQSTQQSEVST